MKPSHSHKNRQAHNWLIYDISDRSLLQHSKSFNGVLVDLGCGEAPYREWFKTYVDSYIGVDWDSSLHQIKPDVVADLNVAVPMDSESADCVIALSVLEHLHSPQTMIQEAFRILKPGGKLFLQVPWQWHIHEAPYDFFRYTPFALRRWLEAAGLVDVQVEAQSGFFSMLVLKLNYFSRQWIRGPKFFRIPIRFLFSCFWYLGQISAPLLDRLDKDWISEATGYFVVAKKPPTAR